jgi:hypothetical protein
MAAWPSSNDYTAAIQSPQICFSDVDLRAASVEKNRLTRMPKVWTGNFAQVYELRTGSGRWAVKCFTRASENLTARYAAISSAVAASNLPYFVDFRFLTDQMLVNGKRYPIVKMQWLEGQSIDKFVEANLFHPHILIDLAAQLVVMVQKLEEQKLAHGDLQHGNVVITSSGLKLVDYDGMFVPSFSGSAAPEIGLPSFQHPRRGAADYAVGLDRFALLVMCTGLCALSVEPSIWYEFYTGDNLLFSAADFRGPGGSKLFQRLSAVNDENVKLFTNALRTACGQGPLGIQVPTSPTLLVKRRPTPWWVTLPPARSTKSPQPTGPTPTRPKQFSHGNGTVILFAIGSAALAAGWAAGWAVGWAAGIAVGAIATSTGGLLFLLARTLQYSKLPALARRRELSAKLAALEREARKRDLERTKAEQQLNALSQQEAAEKGQELKRSRDAHLEAYLSSIPVSRLLSLSGIGPAIIGRLHGAGIQNAAHLKRRGPHVEGVGPKRRGQINGLLTEWERDAARTMPSSLPADMEHRIAAKYRAQKSAAVDRLRAVNAMLAGRRTEASQAESELKQLHVPPLGQFLRNTM